MSIKFNTPAADIRREALHHWLQQTLSPTQFSIKPLQNDASFRRYFRVYTNNKTLIAMDAPPARENCQPFISVNAILRELGVPVPEIIALDLQQGFLLLTDLGDALLLPSLHSKTNESLYRQAFAILLNFHNYKRNSNYALPIFDENFIQTELNYFLEWFIIKYLNTSLTSTQSTLLANVFSLLKRNAQQQPQVFIHRDFHSRNLLCINEKLAVLDFQDAMWGPITYDLVSLLKDCYITWPQEHIERLAIEFYQQLYNQGLLNCSAQQFLMWFHLMGLQRHLKVLGVFSRLYMRDNKPAYLKDLPRVFAYAEAASLQLPELQDFYHFLLILKPILLSKNPL